MKNKGFTLVELLVVMIILGILAFYAASLVVENIEKNKPKIIHMEKDGSTTLKKLDIK